MRPRPISARLAAFALLVSLAAVPRAQQAPWTPAPEEIDAIYPDLEALYIDLHRNPELAFQETRTAATLAAQLKALGFEVTTGVGKTGLVGVLRNGPGPTAMLRTELDALPVQEKTGLPFASTRTVTTAAGQSVPVMHACGHNLHMATWIGTARLLAGHRGAWRGTLVLLGQPAEENLGGALAVLKDGLLTRFPRPDAILSLHDDDTLPAGTIGCKRDCCGQGQSPMRVPRLRSRPRRPRRHAAECGGSGGARIAGIVVALQTVVARENNPIDPVVVTVGWINGGTAGNIIPDEVRLQLSVRTYSEEVRARTLAAIRRVVRGEAIAAGAPREPQVDAPERGNPPVVDNPVLTLRVAAALKRTLGDRIVEMPQKMTSEDFAEYGVAGVPSLLLHVGAVAPERLAEARRTGVPVPAPHSPEWAPDREATLKGAVRAEVIALLDLLGGKV